MNVDELIAKVASEPHRAMEHDVVVHSPEWLREMKERDPVPISERPADPNMTHERRTLRVGHVLGPPLTVDALEAWQRRWPRHPLPADLAALLLRVDGIHLWADLDTGRAYEGLAPVAEWELARVKMWGPDATPDTLPDQYLALTYHNDGSAFVVLDVDRGLYYLMDACGADESCPIGGSADDLLDHLWSHRIP